VIQCLLFGGKMDALADFGVNPEGTHQAHMPVNIKMEKCALK